jgi:hypothetical protein
MFHCEFNSSFKYSWVYRKGRQIFSMHLSKWNKVATQTLFCRYDASKVNFGWPAAKVHGGCRDSKGLGFRAPECVCGRNLSFI